MFVGEDDDGVEIRRIAWLYRKKCLWPAEGCSSVLTYDCVGLSKFFVKLSEFQPDGGCAAETPKPKSKSKSKSGSAQCSDVAIEVSHRILDVGSQIS